MCEITRGMAKHISAYKIQKETSCYIILHNTLYNTNHFLGILEAKIILEFIKKDNYKNQHLANLDRRYLGDDNDDTKILDVKEMIPISDLFIS